jgi:hypothetical protein
MTKTSRERRELPVLMRWPHAGNDFSRPSHRGQRNVRSLISSKRLPRRLSHVCDLTSVQIRRPHPVGITFTPELSAAINPHSARCPAGAPRDFVPWRFLDAGQLSPTNASSFRRPKTYTIADSCGATWLSIHGFPRSSN